MKEMDLKRLNLRGGGLHHLRLICPVHFCQSATGANGYVLLQELMDCQSKLGKMHKIWTQNHHEAWSHQLWKNISF